MHLKMPAAKWYPFCPGADELTHCSLMMFDGIIGPGHHWFWLFLAGFTIDIWKQGSFQTHDLKDNFIKMNKKSKMTSNFYFYMPIFRRDIL